MKRFIYFLFLLPLLPQLSFAQSTYQSSDYIDPTDSVMMSRASAIDLILNDFTTGGTNQNWDYSNMTPASQEWEYFLDPDDTGYEFSYVANCVINCLGAGGFPFFCPFTCVDEWDSLNIAMPTGDTINLGILELTNTVDLLQNTGTKLGQDAIGYTVEVGGLPIPLINQYIQEDVIYRFPLQYGDQDSSVSGYRIDLTQVGIPLTYIHWQTRYNEVDGWGSVSTPYGTFNNALRVKSTINNRDTLIFQGDTLTLTTFLPPALAPDTEVEFKWLDPAHGYPVVIAKGFELLGITTIQRVEFLDSIRCFDPTPLFAAFPIPTYLDSATSQVDVNFFNLSFNADAYTWDFDDPASGTANTSNQANPTHTYTSGGAYFVTLTACSTPCGTPICDDITLPIIVIDTNQVFANFVALPFTGCVGTTVDFTNLSIRDSIWFWDFDDGTTSTLENPSHTYTSPGVYNVMLVASNAIRSDTAYQQITIYDNINASYTYSDTLTDIPIQFTNTSTGTDTSTTFIWTVVGLGNVSTNFSTQENPVITFSDPGTYTVCMSAFNGVICSDISCQTIEIEECLETDFSTGILLTACPGELIQLTNNTEGVSPISYEWYVDGALYSTNVNETVTFNTGGTHTVTLLADNGICQDSHDEDIDVVNPATAGPDQTICPGDQVTLNGGGGGFGTVYNWSPGGGLSCTFCEDPVASPSSTNTYSISFVHPICGVLSDDVTVTVLPETQANYGFNSIVGTLQVEFSDSSNDATSYLWDFGDGTSDTSANPTHIFPSNGTFTVCLTTTNSCNSSTSCQSVTTICPIPEVGFNFSQTGLTTASFLDTTSNNPTSWQWTFGDGNSSNQQNPTHTYSSPGTYDVCLLSGSVCGSELVCEEIVIECLPPTADFGFNENELDLSFFDLSSSDATAWVWNFGDGTTSTQQNPTHTYQQEGTYTICLIAFNVCGTDSICQTITIDCNPPAPAFSVQTSGLVASFQDDTPGLVTGYFWDFGDGTTSTNLNPSHVYPSGGTYTVCMTILSPCGDSTICQDFLFAISDVEDLIAEYGYQLYPNPTEDEAYLTFDLAKPEAVRVRVLDVEGRLVKDIAEGELQAGSHKIELEVEELQGVYLIDLQVGDDRIVRKLVVGS